MGPQHPDTLNSVCVCNLADVPQEKLVLEHPDTLGSVIYQGRLDEAEPLFRWTLEACENELGPEHSSIFISVNNPTLLLEARGQLDEQEPTVEGIPAVEVEDMVSVRRKPCRSSRSVRVAVARTRSVRRKPGRCGVRLLGPCLGA